jgi:hypothetical protein
VQTVDGSLQILELLLSWLALRLDGHILSIACVAVIARLAGLFGYRLLVRSSCPLVADMTDARLYGTMITREGISFLALPLGNQLLLQLPIVIVSAALGASTSATFGVTRTVGQLFDRVLQFFQPMMIAEAALLIGEKRLAALRYFALGAMLCTAIAALVYAGVLHTWGARLFDIWTRRQVGFDAFLLDVFVIGSALRGIWLMAIGIIFGANLHGRATLVYLALASSGIILFAIFCAAGNLLAGVICLLIPEFGMCYRLIRSLSRILKLESVRQ